MKQSKVRTYRPKYPKKLLKGAALTAAAMLAIGGTACDVRTGGIPMPAETPEAQAHTRDGEPALMGKLVADEP